MRHKRQDGEEPIRGVHIGARRVCQAGQKGLNQFEESPRAYRGVLQAPGRLPLPAAVPYKWAWARCAQPIKIGNTEFPGRFRHFLGQACRGPQISGKKKEHKD